MADIICTDYYNNTKIYEITTANREWKTDNSLFTNNRRGTGTLDQGYCHNVALPCFFRLYLKV